MAYATEELEQAFKHIIQGHLEESERPCHFHGEHLPTCQRPGYKQGIQTGRRRTRWSSTGLNREGLMSVLVSLSLSLSLGECVQLWMVSELEFIPFFQNWRPKHADEHELFRSFWKISVVCWWLDLVIIFPGTHLHKYPIKGWRKPPKSGNNHRKLAPASKWGPV